MKIITFGLSTTNVNKATQNIIYMKKAMQRKGHLTFSITLLENSIIFLVKLSVPVWVVPM
jgi:hypothetical protein